MGRGQALRLPPRLLAGTHLGRPQVRCADFALMRLRASRPLPADGEPVAPAAEVDVLVRPSALAVVGRGTATASG
jgi:diacylglycerol kinase family enzyme